MTKEIITEESEDIIYQLIEGGKRVKIETYRNNFLVSTELSRNAEILARIKAALEK